MVSRTARAHPQPYRGPRPTRRSHPDLIANARFKAIIKRCEARGRRGDDKFVILEIRVSGINHWFPVPKRSFERLVSLTRPQSWAQEDFESREYTWDDGERVKQFLLGRLGLFRVRVTMEKGKPHWHCWFKETIQEEEEQ
jgi:hypothetical protein